ncbi:uncharacterized protein METZ01_LOCUS257170, partial [marine metagenome]
YELYRASPSSRRRSAATYPRSTDWL